VAAFRLPKKSVAESAAVLFLSFTTIAALRLNPPHLRVVILELSRIRHGIWTTAAPAVIQSDTGFRFMKLAAKIGSHNDGTSV
jgi:hypothetical protein